MKNVLITGVAGFIGSHLVEALLAGGDRVIGLENFCDTYSPEEKRQNVSAVLEHPQFSLREGDVRDSEWLVKLMESEKPDAVIHLASVLKNRKAQPAADEFYATNVIGCLNVLEACRRSGCRRLIHFSTAAVYDPCTAPSSESDAATNGEGVYQKTKLLGDRLVRDYLECGVVDALILRPTVVYGPRQRPGTVVREFVEAIHRNQPIRLFGDGGAARDMLYVDDCVNAVLTAIDQPDIIGVMNLGTADPVTMRELATLVCETMGVPLSTRSDGGRDQGNQLVSVTGERASSLLSFRPRIEIREGIRRYLDWRN